ncbi:MAG: hypothetical protein ABR923_09270 [Terracidiphilus sp.]
MQPFERRLKPAQDEVHRTAHDQDLIEVPKRARLDREAESNGSSLGPRGVKPVSSSDI